MNKNNKTRLISIGIFLVLGIIVYMMCNQFPSYSDNMVELDLSFDDNTYYIADEDYAAQMKELVEPSLSQIEQSNYFMADDNAKVHYRQYIHPLAKGSIVISHGFTESAEKYKETIYYFLREGYSVYILEHRGHGLSERFVQDKSMVHIDDFDKFIEDLKKFVIQIVQPNNNTKPLFLFSHSMGGGIGSIFLERYPEYFDAAILSAPMMKIDTGAYPEFIAKAIAKLMVFMGKAQEYIFGAGPFTGEFDFEGSANGTIQRYSYYLDKCIGNENLQTNGASFGWLKEALEATQELVKKKNASQAVTPTLLFQAELDHLVKPEAHYKYAKHAPNTSLILVPDAKHEIFTEESKIRVPYFNTIFKFFDSFLQQ